MPTLKKWLSENVVPALTLAGLILYVLLRLPYAIYYGRLGVTPEDAGLGYVEMLAQSALGVAAIVLGVVSVIWVVATAVFYGGILIAAVRARRWHLDSPENVDDEAWAGERAFGVMVWRTVIRASQREVDTIFALDDERRALMRAERSADDDRRLAELGAEIELARFSAIGRSFIRLASWVAAITLLAVVPLFAMYDAQRVRHCQRPLAGRFGLFAVHGAPATVSTVGDDGTLTPVAAGQSLHYLGRADAVVLFDCKDGGHTVRLPPDAIVVTEDT